MKVEHSELDTWERNAVQVNGALVKIQDALGKGQVAGDVEGLRAAIDIAQAANWATRKALIAHGAIDSIRSRAEEGRASQGLPALPYPSLAHMESPANHALLHALEAARAAAQAVQRERQGDDSLVDALTDHLTDVETEIFGPPSMRG